MCMQKTTKNGKYNLQETEQKSLEILDRDVKKITRETNMFTEQQVFYQSSLT